MDKNYKKIIVKSMKVVLVFLFAFSVAVFNNMNNNNIDSITTSSENLSNKKIEWGVKRNNEHKQPNFEKYNIDILNKNKGIAVGNENDKKIYITFDNGYEAGYTDQILNILKENDVVATFFITAHYLNTEPDLVKKMIDNGNIVGNHTVNHKSMPDLTEEVIHEEVMKLHKVVYEKFNYEMKYIRPPMGEFSEKTINITNNLGYKTVMWSFAYEDWNEDKQPDEEKAKKKILDNLHNGEIILLHATSKTNANILGDVIKEIKKQGYEIKSLEDFK